MEGREGKEGGNEGGKGGEKFQGELYHRSSAS